MTDIIESTCFGRYQEYSFLKCCNPYIARGILHDAMYLGTVDVYFAAIETGRADGLRHRVVYHHAVAVTTYIYRAIMRQFH